MLQAPQESAAADTATAVPEAAAPQAASAPASGAEALNASATPSVQDTGAAQTTAEGPTTNTAVDQTMNEGPGADTVGPQQSNRSLLNQAEQSADPARYTTPLGADTTAASVNAQELKAANDSGNFLSNWFNSLDKSEKLLVGQTVSGLVSGVGKGAADYMSKKEDLDFKKQQYNRAVSNTSGSAIPLLQRAQRSA